MASVGSSDQAISSSGALAAIRSSIRPRGATLAGIAEVLGHKTLAMVKRYAHLIEGHTRVVLERRTSRFL